MTNESIMAKKILILGLPESGTSLFAENLAKQIELTGKKIKHVDFDNFHKNEANCNFQISSLGELAFTDQEKLKADWIIWMDTIKSKEPRDKNHVFIVPNNYDFRVNEQNNEKWAPFIAERILKNTKRPTFDWQKETVLMLGRFQPWHKGHRALFERAVAKTGQVIIQIRDCQGWKKTNPYHAKHVVDLIKHDLDMLYQGQYEVQIVPNITNITYGRDVGYKIEQEVFDENIHKISATKIRKEMGLE